MAFRVAVKLTTEWVKRPRLRPVLWGAELPPRTLGDATLPF